LQDIGLAVLAAAVVAAAVAAAVVAGAAVVGASLGWGLFTGAMHSYPHPLLQHLASSLQSSSYLHSSS